jgi:hypothetical protein
MALALGQQKQLILIIVMLSERKFNIQKFKMSE